MISGATVAVPPSCAGMRLDLFLRAQFPSTTRAFAAEAISRGDVLLNGKASEKGARLGTGDSVSAIRLLEEDDNFVRPDPSVHIAVVHDDGFILGVNKPPGLPVQPLSPLEDGSLAGGAVALRPELALVGHEPLAAGAVHRIDAGTSGLVLFALNNFIYAAMRSLFSSHSVEKRYLALACGKVLREGSIACELAHDPSRGYCRMVDAATLTNAKRAHVRLMSAETRYRPLAAPHGGFTLVEVTIFTGVTHQIRSQLAMAGHPIAGDALYGGATAAGIAPQGGFCLHSLSATFTHPATSAQTTITAPPPSWAHI